MGRNLGGGVPFREGGAGSPSNPISPRLSPTSATSGILMHPAVCHNTTVPFPWGSCVRWGPISPPKGAQPPIFGPCPLGPNVCMYQDTTWYGGRAQPRRNWVRWRPSSPFPKGHTPTQVSAHVYCDQTAEWMRTPLGTEIDLGPGHIMFDGDPAPPAKGAQQPSPFRPMSIVVTVAHLSYW